MSTVNQPNSPQENSPQSPEGLRASIEKFRSRFLIAGLVVVVFVFFVSIAIFIGKKDGLPTLPALPQGYKPETLEEKLANQSKIKKFNNYEDIQNFIESGQEAGAYDGLKPLKGQEEFSISNGPSDSAQSERSTAMDSSGGGFSTTNVQVEGVDEADMIKTDGKYIYAVSGKEIKIIEATPAEQARIISTITLNSQVQNIYINGDRLIASGEDSVFASGSVYRSFKRQSQYTFLKIFDISDKKEPQLVRSLSFEGNYFNSRMIGDHVYFLTSTYTTYYEDEIPVPRVLEDEKELYSYKGGGKCDKCPDVYYFDMPYDSFQFVNIAAINIKEADSDINNEVYLLSGNQNLYVSQENIYITYTKYVSEYDLRMEVTKEIVLPKLSQKDEKKINQIEATESYILSPREKKEKISRIIERYKNSLSDNELRDLEENITEKLNKKYEDFSKELEKTVIHKINIDKGNVSYHTFGEVPGNVLNQFSMDERDGYFRIATTKNQAWRRGFINSVPMIKEDIVASEPEALRESPQVDESYSNLYVLDGDLKIVGSVEGLAKGEKIYSVRFMQDRAYMVTFEQVDPLFVIDMKDPREPKVLGELKIPGFSNYLHPYDENILMGIGKETQLNEFGRVETRGVKISLFDVSDLGNPREIDKFELGEQGSDSIALHDHKAFLFSKEKNLLVIPVTAYGAGDDRYGSKMTFNGAVVFTVNKEGLSLKGKIAHSSVSATGSNGSESYNYYDTGIQRSLYIDDMLYTYSPKAVQINKLENLETVKNLSFVKTAIPASSGDLSCQSDSDCAVKLLEDDCCGGQYACRNKSFQEPEPKDMFCSEDITCATTQMPDSCSCVNNRCAAKSMGRWETFE